MNRKKSFRIISYIIALLMLATVILPMGNGKEYNAYAAGETYRILEIEPTNNYQDYFYTWYEKQWHGGWVQYACENWEEFVTFALGKTNAQVKVTKMTVAEFNGKQEDLSSSYDLIYIGVKGNNDDSSFKDYSHMGEQTVIGGAISNKYETTQKAGDDITADKKNELIEYADAGYPVLVSGYVYQNNGLGNNKLRLESQSNMYDLLANKLGIQKNNQNYYSKYTNVISCTLYSEMSDELLQKISNAFTPMEKKCSLNILEQPEHAGYINKTDLNNRELKFRFNISDYNADAGNATYKAELFIDLNSDGKYDASERMNQYMQVSSASTGTRISADALKKGTDYILTRDIGDYVGIIYWKLRITKYVAGIETPQRDELIDYCKVQPKILVNGKEELVKKSLKILQIMANEGSGSGGTGENNVWLPTEKEAAYLEAKYKTSLNQLGSNPTDTQRDNLADNIARAESGISNEYFNLYGKTKKIKYDYLKVTMRFWLYTRSLNDFEINIQRIPVSAFQSGVENGTVNVNSYDMLILGFADCYTDINNEKALKAIDGFIKDGKTILFTHDTTSFVTESPSTGRADDWGYHINKYFRDMLGMDRYGYLSQVYDYYDADETNKDYVWSSQGNRDYTRRAHGYSNYLLDNTMDNSISHKHTTTIKAVNTGQITTYPYKIPTDVDIADTHGQYYQLDLEADDVVVWYCLSGGDNNYYGGMNSDGISKKDVRNNYYIYNRKNITYSGAGHSGKLTDNEVKLFINTMVGAYRVASSGISIDITNQDASRDKNGNVFFTISYLKDNYKQPIASNLVMVDGKPAKRIAFTLRENSVAVTGNMSIKFGNISKIYDENKNVVSEISQNKVYYVDIPISQLESQEKMEMDAVLTISFAGDVNATGTKSITKKIVFMRRTLFNLN